MQTNNFTFAEWTSNGITLRGSAHISNTQNSTWVIMAHGFTGDRIGKGYLLVKLSKFLLENSISSLRFDFAGAGESDGNLKDTTIESMVNDLSTAVRYVRQHYKPSRLLVLGHSFGGLIASLLTAESSVDGVILLAPVADPSRQATKEKTVHLISKLSDELFYYGPHQLSITFFNSFKDVNGPAVLKNFKNPVLLIQGEKDQTVQPDDSKQYLESGENHNVSYVLIKGADHHFLSVKQRQELTHHVQMWLKEHFCE
jgi:alpha-beta hydrolase superfamily lysophospholipase